MSLAAQLIRRLALAAATIATVTVMNFVLFRVLPGDPAQAVRDPRMSAADQAAMRQRFGLDRPLLVGADGRPFDSQLFRYLGSLARGDLGISFTYKRPVAAILRERLANTLLLVLTGELLAIGLGIALGTLAAYKRGTPWDVAALLLAIGSWATPVFVLGIALLIAGSNLLGLPVGGIRTPGASYERWWDEAVDVGRHMLLPTLTMALVLLGQYVLIVRSALLDVLVEPYILTARAKGLADGVALRAHALPNAMLPVVALIALTLGFTVGGSILVESVFSWPGLGRAVYEAVNRRDYPVLQGAFLLFTVSVVLANTAADLCYAALDPRVRSPR